MALTCRSILLGSACFETRCFRKTFNQLLSQEIQRFSFKHPKKLLWRWWNAFCQIYLPLSSTVWICFHLSTYVPHCLNLLSSVYVTHWLKLVWSVYLCHPLFKTAFICLPLTLWVEKIVNKEFMEYPLPSCLTHCQRCSWWIFFAEKVQDESEAMRKQETSAIQNFVQFSSHFFQIRWQRCRERLQT